MIFITCFIALILLGTVGYLLWLVSIKVPQREEEERLWKQEKKEKKRLKKLAKQARAQVQTSTSAS